MSLSGDDALLSGEVSANGPSPHTRPIQSRVVIKESWWNGRPEPMARRRVRLRHDLGMWMVEILDPSRDEVVHCANEADAREVLRRELAAGQQWRRLDLHQPQQSAPPHAVRAGTRFLG